MSLSSRTTTSAPHTSSVVEAPPHAWVMLAIGTVLVALGLGSLPAFYGFYILLGGLGFAAVNVPIIANVGLWFARRRGPTLGILLGRITATPST